jgi:hypothetical protein
VVVGRVGLADVLSTPTRMAGMCRFTPRIRPCRRDMTSTFAPANCSARIGTVNSTFSKPSAARAAIRRPCSCRMLRSVPPDFGGAQAV